MGERAHGGRDRGVLRQGRIHRLGARRDGDEDAEGAAPGVRGVEPGDPRAGGRGVRGLPHAVRAGGGAQGERPLGPEPAPERESGVPDLSPGARAGAAGAGADDPGPAPCALAAGGDGDDGHARRDRGGEEGGGDRRGPRGRRRASPEGAVAARLRGGGELHGLPRPPGAGAHPRRRDRLCPSGPAGGGPSGEEVTVTGRVLLLGAVVFALAAPPVAAQPASGAPEVKRPAFQVRRFDEDWSVLRGVDLSGTDDFWDRLKFIPLNQDGSIYLTLGGQVRLRAEYFNEFQLGASAPETSDGYLLSRIMLSADLHVTRYFRVFVEGKSSLATDRDLQGENSNAFVDEIDLQNGFADVMIP